MERERVRAVEGLTEEFERVQQQAVVYKRKMEAAKARTAVLERDNKKARESIATLLKKTSTDDELIEALRREVTEGRRRQGELSNELGSTRADLARTTSMKGAKVLTVRRRAVHSLQRIPRLAATETHVPTLRWPTPALAGGRVRAVDATEQGTRAPARAPGEDPDQPARGAAGGTAQQQQQQRRQRRWRQWCPAPPEAVVRRGARAGAAAVRVSRRVQACCGGTDTLPCSAHRVPTLPWWC